MKIAFISGGSSIHERRLATKAKERGHEVALISMRHTKVEFNIPGVDFYHYYPRTPRLRVIPMVLHLRKLLRRIRPDVIVTSNPSTYGFFAALSGFHPHVALPWGTDVLHIPYNSWVARQETRFTLRQADMVICLSSEIQTRVQELSSGPLSKFPIVPVSSPDNQRFAPQESWVRRELGWHDNKVLIMTRSPYPVIYGVEFFVEALPIVLAAEPDTRIIMVGSGSLDREVRARVTEMGLQDKVHFAGRVDNDDMPAYLNAADIYVSTSFTDGASVSLLEAMACGLPVVVSDIFANRDWIKSGENGLLINIGDYDAVRNAINKHLRKNPDLYNQLEASSQDYPLPISTMYVRDISAALITLLRDPPARNKMGARNIQIVRERGGMDVSFSELERLAQQLIAKRRSGRTR
jgi:glycosyltransferase involved in cell wall biosynthesis